MFVRFRCSTRPRSRTSYLLEWFPQPVSSGRLPARGARRSPASELSAASVRPPPDDADGFWKRWALLIAGFPLLARGAR
jgi:hypothetical protein